MNSLIKKGHENDVGSDAMHTFRAFRHFPGLMQSVSAIETFTAVRTAPGSLNMDRKRQNKARPVRDFNFFDIYITPTLFI